MIGNWIRTLAKNVPLAVVILVVMASTIAVSCDPGDSGLRASPFAFKSACGTTLYYNVPAIVNASPILAVLDQAGSDVRVYPLGIVTPGNHELHWDAKDGAGINVPDGTYTIRLNIINDTETITRTCNAVVDNIAPGTTISFSKPTRADGSYDRGVAFSLAGSDTGSGICSYHYKVNDRCWERWCSPVALNDAGQYTIRYKAIDNAGNYEIQTIALKVAADDASVTPAPAPTLVPTPTPVPMLEPSPGPLATPSPTATPVPEQIFYVNPGSVSVNDGGQISYATGNVQSQIDDRLIGGFVDFNLTRMPEQAFLYVYVRSSPEATQASQFKLAVLGSGGAIQDYAGVLVVDHPTLANGADIASATVTMKVSRAWVESRGGADTVKILRYSDGVVETLDTRYIGMDGDQMVYQALSPHGLSTFALAALSAPAAANAAEPPAGQPIGQWVYIGALSIVAAICGAVIYFVTLRHGEKKRLIGK